MRFTTNSVQWFPGLNGTSHSGFIWYFSNDLDKLRETGQFRMVLSADVLKTLIARSEELVHLSRKASITISLSQAKSSKDDRSKW